MEGKKLTKEILDYILEDRYCNPPIPLSDVTDDDLDHTWLYSRKHGFFGKVDAGYHNIIASYLYGLLIVDELEKTWNPQIETLKQYIISESVYNMDEYSEKFFMMKGTAMLSGVYYSTSVKVGKYDNLTRTEKLKLCKGQKIKELL